MKKLLVLIVFLAGCQISHAQHAHEPKRLPLPLLYEFAHISWQRPTVKWHPEGAQVTCRSLSGRDTTLILSSEEYVQFIDVVKGAMKAGVSDPSAIRSLYTFIQWSTPYMSVCNGIVTLSFPHISGIPVPAQVPVDEYRKLLDMQIETLVQQREMLHGK